MLKELLSKFKPKQITETIAKIETKEKPVTVYYTRFQDESRYGWVDGDIAFGGHTAIKVRSDVHKYLNGETQINNRRAIFTQSMFSETSPLVVLFKENGTQVIFSEEDDVFAVPFPEDKK